MRKSPSPACGGGVGRGRVRFGRGGQSFTMGCQRDQNVSAAAGRRVVGAMADEQGVIVHRGDVIGEDAGRFVERDIG